MPIMIYPREIMRRTDLWAQSRNGCSCGRYAFYLECGHLHGQPMMLKCGKTRQATTGFTILCYRPAPLVHVYNVVVRGRCEHCQYGKSLVSAPFWPPLW